MLDRHQLHALRLIGDQLLGGPAGGRDAPLKVGQLLVWHVDFERADGEVGRGGHAAAFLLLDSPPSRGASEEGWPYRQGWRSFGQRDANEFHHYVAPGKYPDGSLVCAVCRRCSPRTTQPPARRAMATPDDMGTERRWPSSTPRGPGGQCATVPVLADHRGVACRAQSPTSSLVSLCLGWVPRSIGTHGSSGDRRTCARAKRSCGTSTSTPHSSLSRTRHGRARAGSPSRSPDSTHFWSAWLPKVSNMDQSRLTRTVSAT